MGALVSGEGTAKLTCRRFHALMAPMATGRLPCYCVKPAQLSELGHVNNALFALSVVRNRQTYRHQQLAEIDHLADYRGYGAAGQICSRSIDRHATCGPDASTIG